MDQNKENNESEKGCIIPILIFVAFVVVLCQQDEEFFAEAGFHWMLILGAGGIYYIWKLAKNK